MSKTAWITGGGGAIGGALAILLAKQGWRVIISGRTQTALDNISNQHANIETMLLDICDSVAVQKTIEIISPIDLAVLNAGYYEPKACFDTKMVDYRKAMDVNYFGNLDCLLQLAKLMRGTGGHIAVVGSLAGYIGLPNASGYGASKAALISVCESMRAELLGSSIKLQLINPGFVKSELTSKNNFQMPYLIDATKAAEEIFLGLEKDKFEIAFPKPFVRRMKLLQMLPYRLYFKLMERITKNA